MSLFDMRRTVLVIYARSPEDDGACGLRRSVRTGLVGQSRQLDFRYVACAARSSGTSAFSIGTLTHAALRRLVGQKVKRRGSVGLAERGGVDRSLGRRSHIRNVGMLARARVSSSTGRWGTMTG